MGSVCSAQKNQSKSRSQNEELKNNNQPYLEASSLIGQSLPMENKQDAALDQYVQDLLQLFKRFCMFLDLVGNLDQLPQHTREKINNCIIVKQNISITQFPIYFYIPIDERDMQQKYQLIHIIIQNNIKRVMREQQIIKRIDESDYYLIYNDRKFASAFNQMMQKLSNIIINELKPDEDFQSAFPILAVSFEEEAQKIIVGLNLNCSIIQLWRKSKISKLLQCEKEVLSIRFPLIKYNQNENLPSNEIKLFISSFKLFIDIINCTLFVFIKMIDYQNLLTIQKFDPNFFLNLQNHQLKLFCHLSTQI